MYLNFKLWKHNFTRGVNNYGRGYTYLSNILLVIFFFKKNLNNTLLKFFLTYFKICLVKPGISMHLLSKLPKGSLRKNNIFAPGFH